MLAREPPTHGEMANFHMHIENSSEIGEVWMQTTGTGSPNFKQALNLTLRTSGSRQDMGESCGPTSALQVIREPIKHTANGSDANCHCSQEQHRTKTEIHNKFFFFYFFFLCLFSLTGYKETQALEVFLSKSHAEKRWWDTLQNRPMIQQWMLYIKQIKHSSIQIILTTMQKYSML